MRAAWHGRQAVVAASGKPRTGTEDDVTAGLPGHEQPAAWPTMRSMTATSARADVPTATPERYAKQLLSHLGRRTSWTTDGNRSSAEIAGGTGEVVVGDGVLTLIASAPDADALARVQHVLGDHLERFGQRNELAVTWLTDDGRAESPTPPAPADHQRPAHD